MRVGTPEISRRSRLRHFQTTKDFTLGAHAALPAPVARAAAAPLLRRRARVRHIYE